MAGHQKKQQIVVVGCLLLAGCRAHAPICAHESCRVSSAPGAGGETAEAPAASDDGGAGGAGGAGAAGPESECRSDRDCAAGTRCDGEERCLDGACIAGEPVQCRDGTICDAKAADGECIYEERSPWLLIASSDRIVGSPRARLAHEPMLTLAEREGATFNTAFYKMQWSPTGSDALAFAFEVEQGMSLARFRFGAGLPEPAPLDELPTWFDVGSGEMTAIFSNDGARMAVDEGGLFLFQLDGAAPTRWVDSHADALCAEPDSWLGSSGVVSLVEDELKEQPLVGEAYPSPDGRWVIEAGAPGRLVPCAAAGTAVDLGAIGSVVWSADSRYAAIALDDGALRVLSLSDPAAPIEVWAHPAASQHGFAATSDALVVKLADAGAHSLLSLLGAEAAALRELSLAADACVVGIGADLLLARWPCADEGEDEIVWLPLHEPAMPESISPGAVRAYDPAQGLAVLDPGAGEQMRLLQIDRQGYRLQPILSKGDGYDYDFHISPDGRGLAVLTSLDVESVVDFYPIDPSAGDLQAKVPLAVGARWLGWQPWR